MSSKSLCKSLLFGTILGLVLVGCTTTPQESGLDFYEQQTPFKAEGGAVQVSSDLATSGVGASNTSKAGVSTAGAGTSGTSTSSANKAGASTAGAGTSGTSTETPQQPPDSAEETVAVYPPRGAFINTRAATKPAPVKQTNGEITLNFEAVNIRDVVKVVFDTLQENYVIDPQVQGEVTVQTGRPLPKDLLIPTLETLLRMNNAALVQADGLYKIVPLNAAVVGSLSPRLNNKRLRSGYGVRIFPLRYIGVQEMEKILTPFVPEGSILSADKARNLLLLAGTAQELAVAQETIDIFDVNWLKGMSVGVFTMQNVDVQTVANELSNVFGEGSELPIAGMIRFVPVNKLNAIIAISTQPEYLNEIGSWIDRLDGSGGERLYVYEVQNSNADYLATLLNQVFSLSGGGGGSQGGQVAPGLSPTQISSSLSSGSGSSLGGASSGGGASLGGGSSSLSSGSSLGGSSLGGSSLPSGGTSTSGAASSAAKRGTAGSKTAGATVSSARSSGTVSSGGQGSALAGEVRIVADVENNSLLIWANKQNYEKIVAALRKLDTTPRQVLVEVTIAEVTLSGNLKYGVQWFFTNDVGKYKGTGTNGLGNSVKVDDILTNTALKAAGSTFTYAISDSAGVVRALLDTLANESKVRILSSPQVMVIDNQEATIRVGNQQPISTGTTVLSGSDNTISAIQFKDTGVLLTVRPQVNAGGLVNMDILQQVIDVGQDIDTATGQRPFFERSVKSKVAIQSSQSIVLAGLISETHRNGQSGIPILYKLPVIGPLFGTTSDNTERTELLVLITPTVISSSREAQAVTEELKRRMQGIDPIMLEPPHRQPPKALR